MFTKNINIYVRPVNSANTTWHIMLINEETLNKLRVEMLNYQALKWLWWCYRLSVGEEILIA